MMCGVVTSVKPWHKLFHAGVEMDERERLQDYGVQANAVVYLACGGKDAPPPIIKSTADNNNNNSNSNNNNNNNNKRFRPLKGKPLGDVLVRTGRTAPQPKYSEEADDEIVVRIKHGIVPAAFRVNRHSTKMRTVFELFANQCGCPVDRLKVCPLVVVVCPFVVVVHVVCVCAFSFHLVRNTWIQLCRHSACSVCWDGNIPMN